MFEVIECAWVEFSQRLTAVADLDSLLAAHDQFLASVERKAMLRPEDEEMHTALKGLFETILAFARSQDVLYMSLLEQKAAARQHAAAVAATAAASGSAHRRWGAKGGVSDAALGVVQVEPRLVEQMNRSAAEYRKRFSAFFTLVRRHASYDLAFLAFRTPLPISRMVHGLCAADGDWLPPPLTLSLSCWAQVWISTSITSHLPLCATRKCERSRRQIKRCECQISRH